MWCRSSPRVARLTGNGIWPESKLAGFNHCISQGLRLPPSRVNFQQSTIFLCRFFSQQSARKASQQTDIQKPSKGAILQYLENFSQELENISLADVRDIGRELAILLYRLVLAYSSFYCIYEYGFFFVQCDGPSMMPTMNEFGEIVLVERVAPRVYGIQGGCRGQERIRAAKQQQKQHSNPEEWHQAFVPVNEMPQQAKWDRFWKHAKEGISRGDIVVAENPSKSGTVCKRVIGLPGDEIIPKRSQYTSSHFVGKSRNATAKLRKSLHTVPDGHVWLEGDNSANSHDSRSYGTIPASMIVGRVILRVWPPGTDPILGRAIGPKSPGNLGQPRWASQASAVLPAGYEGQRLVRQHR